MKKKYVIVGDNNFWYATTGELTQEELAAEIANIKANLTTYETGDLGHTCELYAFEVANKTTFNVSDVANEDEE